MHNLLDDPVLQIRIGETVTLATLPDVLAALSLQQPVVFTRLQTHQEAAWGVFLSSLGALCTSRRSVSFPQPSDWWYAACLECAGGQLSAFDLVQTDLTKPAFFQFPVEDNLRNWSKDCALNFLEPLPMTANDFYRHRSMVAPEPDHLAYTLATAQIGAGSNSGYYTVGGRTPSEGRLYVYAWPGFNNGRRFCREVYLLARNRVDALDHGFCGADGLALPWSQPLPYDKTLKADQLDPHFIDVGVYQRVTCEEGTLFFYKRAQNPGQPLVQRINYNPWSPISDEGRVVSVPKTFGYQELHKLLFVAKTPITALGHPDDDDITPIVLEGTPRVNAQTLGFHRQILYLPLKIRNSFHDQAQPQLAAYSQSLVERASRIESILQESLDLLGRRSDEGKKAFRKALRSMKANRLRFLNDEVSRLYPQYLFQWKDEPTEILQSWTVALFATADQLFEETKAYAASPRHLHGAEKYYQQAREKELNVTYPRDTVDTAGLTEAQVQEFCSRLSGWLRGQSLGTVAQLRRIDSNRLDSAAAVQIARWLVDFGVEDSAVAATIIEAASLLAHHPRSYSATTSLGAACGRARIPERRFQAWLKQKGNLHSSSIVRMLEYFNWADYLLLRLAQGASQSTIQRRLNFDFYTNQR